MVIRPNLLASPLAFLWINARELAQIEQEKNLCYLLFSVGLSRNLDSLNAPTVLHTILTNLGDSNISIDFVWFIHRYLLD